MTDRKFPTPFYAAAGAGEAIVEELKKLPSKVEDLRDRAKLEERAQAVGTAVRDNVSKGVATLKGLDADKVRSAANDTASTLGEKAREARTKATQTYAELVERGEHVANGERSPIKVIATIAQKSEATTTPPAPATAPKAAADKPNKPAAKKTTRKAAPKAKAATK